MGDVLRTELSDGSIRVRMLDAQDADTHLEAALESVTEVGRYLAWCQADRTLEQSRQWVESRPDAWASGESYEFAIEDLRTGRLLGCCGLNRIDRPNGCANMGYWVRTSAAGRGAMTAAARLVLQFGFEDLELQRIEIFAASSNRASQRVAEKLGAVREGVLRRRFIIDGEPQDGVLFAVTIDDWREERGA